MWSSVFSFPFSHNKSLFFFHSQICLIQEHTIVNKYIFFTWFWFNGRKMSVACQMLVRVKHWPMNIMLFTMKVMLFLSCILISLQMVNIIWLTKYLYIWEHKVAIIILLFSPFWFHYFFSIDGRLLPLDEVWSQCPTHYQTHLKDNKWSTLTQQVS